MKLATTTGDLCKFYPLFEQSCEKIEILHKCGFKHIDLSMYAYEPNSPFYGKDWEYHIDKIGNLAAKLGVDFVQAHSTNSVYEVGEEYEQRNKMLVRQLEICNKLNIPMTVIHANCTWDGSRKDFFDRNTAFYRELLNSAEKLNVKVLTENTCKKNNPFYYLIDAADYFEMKEMLGNHELFGYCWDIGHAHIEGVDQYKELVALGTDLKAVHIHDNFGHVYSDKLEFKDIDTHMAPFAGTCNYDEIIQGLLDAEYKGYFTLEACNAMRWHESYTWNPRKLWSRDSRLLNPPTELRVAAEKLLYQTAKTMLETYHCFEE